MRRLSFEFWLVLIILVANAYALMVPANSLVNWFHSDDAFYYFKTAQNISEGYGVTFDRLGRDSGFHPLWMMVCVPVFALARFDLILPLRGIVAVSALLSAGTALLIYKTGKRFLHPAAAAFAALFIAFDPKIHAEVVEMGMESGISAFFIALLLYRVVTIPERSKRTAKWLVVTGFIGGLTILARLDNVFLVFVLAAWVIIRPVRMRYLLIADTALITFGVLWSYFARVGFGPQYAQIADSSYWMVVSAVMIRLLSYYLFGLFDRPKRGYRGLMQILLRAGAASLLSSALLSGLMLGLNQLNAFPGFPRMTLLYQAGFGLAAVLISRWISWLTVQKSSGFAQQAQDDRLDWASTLRRAGFLLAPIALILASYIGWNLWYFGTASPVSGQIKRWWGTLPNVIYGQPVTELPHLLGFLDRASPWGVVRELISFPAGLSEPVRLILYGIPVGLLIWWQRKRILTNSHALALFPLFVGCFLQIISYTGTGYVHIRGWYWVAEFILSTLFLAVLLDGLIAGIAGALAPAQQERRGRKAASARLEKKQKRRPQKTGFARTGAWRTQKWPYILVTCLTIVIIASGMARLISNLPPTVTPENREYYLTGIREMEMYTEPGALIGSTGGGVIAYFATDRTIVNLDGLMNTNEYYQMLKAGTASQYLDRINLNYVYGGEYPITSSDPYFQFKGRLHKLQNFWGATLFKWE